MSYSEEQNITGEMSDLEAGTIEQNETSLATLKTQGLIQGHVGSYRSFTLARSAAYEQSTKPRRIVFGDRCWYWVVTPADAERLVHSGYELA